jgi:ankyrin repeat protein
LNDRGNLPLHAACSFQATADVVEVLLRAYPGGASQPNGVGNLPIHQAAMWQAPVETIEVLLQRHPEGATVRNQYGSLPLHMAASNRASPEVVKLLIDAYPDALHLQNDDGMTPLDLAMAAEDNGGSGGPGTILNDQVVAMLEGRPAPPEMTRRQKADQYNEKADMLERKMLGMRSSSGPGSRSNNNIKLALAAVRKLADRFPHALYSAGMDPNELEIAFSDQLEGTNGDKLDAETILMEAIRKRNKPQRDARGVAIISPVGPGSGPRDRVEELLSSIIGLDHIKSQVRYLCCCYFSRERVFEMDGRDLLLTASLCFVFQRTNSYVDYVEQLRFVI